MGPLYISLLRVTCPVRTSLRNSSSANSVSYWQIVKPNYQLDLFLIPTILQAMKKWFVGNVHTEFRLRFSAD